VSNSATLNPVIDRNTLRCPLRYWYWSIIALVYPMSANSECYLVLIDGSRLLCGFRKLEDIIIYFCDNSVQSSGIFI